jgi:hypothetical protein
MPATVKEAMKYGPPLSPKLREQIVSATHNVAPSMYTLRAGVIFTMTVLPCPSGTVPLQAPTLGTSSYKALIPHAFVTPVQFDRFLTFFPKHNLGYGTRSMNEMTIFHEPFEYLTELQRHSAAFAARPSNVCRATGHAGAAA